MSDAARRLRDEGLTVAENGPVSGMADPAVVEFHHEMWVTRLRVKLKPEAPNPKFPATLDLRWHG